MTENESIRTLQDAIYREKVERARKMTLGERLAAGPELFEEAMGRMKIGIRMRHPDADEQEIDRLLEEQMDRLQAWHERDLYRPPCGDRGMTSLEALRATIDALDAAQAPYMLTGSFASNAYGIARSTKDADLVVDFQVADLDKILAHLDSRSRLH